MYDRHRALIQKAATERLSEKEHATLMAVLEKLNTLDPGCRVEIVDPNDVATAEYDAHYRRKDELDRKFFSK